MFQLANLFGVLEDKRGVFLDKLLTRGLQLPLQVDDFFIKVIDGLLHQSLFLELFAHDLVDSLNEVLFLFF